MANSKATAKSKPKPKNEDPDTTNDAWVEPVKSVDDAPTGHVSGSSMRCWNCKNHGVKPTPRLNDEGVCDNCGFDVKTVYNGQIEADRAAQKVEAARQAERG